MSTDQVANVVAPHTAASLIAAVAQSPGPPPVGSTVAEEMTLRPVNPTPRGTIARLASRPQYRPPLAKDEYDRPDGPHSIGQIKRGFFIAVDGRWERVEGCTKINGMVQVDTARWKFEAHEVTPCFLVQLRSGADALPTRR